MVKVLFQLLVIGCSFFSCSTEKSEIETLINDLNIHVEGINAIIVVPLDGCSGCIHKTVNFMAENVGRKNIAYVITDYGIKRAKMMHLYEQENPMLFMDSKARARKLGLVKFYPVLYNLDSDNPQGIELTALTIDSVFHELKSQF